MAIAAVCNQSLCLCDCLIEGLCLVHSQYRRQLLVCKLLAQLYGLNLTDQDLGIFRNINACELCDRVCFLTNDLCVQRAVDDDCLSYLLKLIRL